MYTCIYTLFLSNKILFSAILFHMKETLSRWLDSPRIKEQDVWVVYFNLMNIRIKELDLLVDALTL